ncbi:MAG: hypothetical protein QXS20_07125 [Candidatus Thorarchaeota archaeon]
MEEECSQWENLAKELEERDRFYQAGNQYRQAASCYLERAAEMSRKAAENFHIQAEVSSEANDHDMAATAYFEAATQYRQMDEYDTALTLFENAAEQALQVGKTETAAQSYLWAAFSCHRLGNKEYFLTCAENMANLYSKAAEEAFREAKAERAVMDLSLAAMGLATINRTSEAQEKIAKARMVIDRTIWDWLRTILDFAEALANRRLSDASRLLRRFEQEETIQELMDACLSIVEETIESEPLTSTSQ